MTTIEQPTRARPAYREVEVDVEVRHRQTVADGVVTLTLADPAGQTCRSGRRVHILICS